MPIDPPLTSDVKLAEALPGSAVTVPKASVSMMIPGMVVAAPTAPLSGPIPEGQAVVAAPVIDWPDSTRMRLAIAGMLSAALDAGFNVALPIFEAMLTSEKPLDWRALLVAVLRPAGTAALSAAFAYFTKTSNKVVR